MAPAFGLAENFQNIVGEEGLDEWENRGFRPYFHHGLNEEIKLGLGFYGQRSKDVMAEHKPLQL